MVGQVWNYLEKDWYSNRLNHQKWGRTQLKRETGGHVWLNVQLVPFYSSLPKDAQEYGSYAKIGCDVFL